MKILIKLFFILTFFLYSVFATQIWGSFFQGEDDASSISILPQVDHCLVPVDALEDLKDLDVYTSNLRKYHIHLKKIFSLDQGQFFLTFQPMNPPIVGVFEDYTRFLSPSFFPSLKKFTIHLDISHRQLTLDEFQQAVELAQNNTALVDFKTQRMSHCMKEQQARYQQQCLLQAWTYRNALIRGIKKNVLYTCSLKNEEEQLIIANGIEKISSLERLEVDFLYTMGSRIFESAMGKPFLTSAHFGFLNGNMNGQKLAPLFPFVRETPSLKFLKLRFILDGRILDVLTDFLRSSFSHVKQMEFISLGGKEGVSEEKINNFFQALGENEHLDTLRLEHFPLDNFPLFDHQNIINAIRTNTTLRTLTFLTRDISQEKIDFLSEGLKENRNIEIKLIIPEEED